MTDFYQFLSGASMMGSFVVAGFFFRFGARTSDVFFSIFGWAFLVLGFERILMLIDHVQQAEKHPLIYLVRLLAFALILFAVIKKNRERGAISGK